MNAKGLTVVACLLLFAGIALAEDGYYRIPLSAMTTLERTDPPAATERRDWTARRPLYQYAMIDGGEAFIRPAGQRERWEAPPTLADGHMVVCAPAADELTGMIVIPAASDAGLSRIRFSVKTSGTGIARGEFLDAKRTHYRDLMEAGVPGAAWFRHQIDQITSELGDAVQVNDQRRRFGRNDSELNRTFELFGGGRAVSENLQLDRQLEPTTQQSELTVETSGIVGITVQEMDFKPLIGDAKPELDPLASLVPFDQHAMFFPSFTALTATIDRAQNEGSLLAGLVEDSAAGDAQTQARYERQLCLPLTALGRAIGPAVVESVVVTGSDPYLRIGSDVAVLFESRNADVLATLLAAPSQAAAANAEVKAVSGQIGDVTYSGVRSADRSICSYRATLGRFVVVTNSLVQLERIVSTQTGKTQALASLPEYIFFRVRYPRGGDDETALLVLSDATIRRWCGPRWRIADSRRTRAAGALADAQARFASAIVAGTQGVASTQPSIQTTSLDSIDLGRTGANSAVYGSLDFMTPIAELDLDRVTEAESRAYAQWRINYQRNWRWAFDPIAFRIGIKDDQLTGDLTVIPLIANTEYRQFIAISTGATLKPGAGDPHNAIGHLALAVNPDSDTLRSWGRMMQNLSGNLRVEPLAWLGSCIAIYADPDPFWKELIEAANDSQFTDKNLNRLPVGIHLESRDPLRLAAFLTAARAFVEQAAPGITTWETMEHNSRPYVKIGTNAGDEAGSIRAIYYVTTPKALVLSLNEAVIRRALDRQAAATQPTTQPAHEWLGGNLSAHIGREMVDVLESTSRSSRASAMQVAAWNAIPILNEWKRGFPDKDPVSVHQKLFATRLTDPAGGGYVWNDQWQTMESSLYGHPGQPKSGPALTEILSRYSGDMGITFEQGGLRAQARIQRRPGP